jgi:hypothetical protein
MLQPPNHPQQPKAVPIAARPQLTILKKGKNDQFTNRK